MRTGMICLLATATLFVVAKAAPAQESDSQIADALNPLPEQLKADARVVRIVGDGTREVLREGANGVTCRPDILPEPPYVVRCHPSALESLFDRLDVLIQVDGMSSDEAKDIVLAEIREGTLPSPVAGSATYLSVGSDRESASLLTAIMIPMATQSEVAIGVEEDHHRPWLMWSGTELSHVMLHGM